MRATLTSGIIAICQNLHIKYNLNNDGTGPSINEDEIINCLLNNIESNKYYEFVAIRRERTRNMQLVYSNCYMTLSNFDSDGTLHSEIASALNSLQNNDELKKG